MEQTFLIGGKEIALEIVERSDSHVILAYDGVIYHYALKQSESGSFVLERHEDGSPPCLLRGFVGRTQSDGSRSVWVDGFELRVATPSRRRTEGSSPMHQAPVAPLSGIVQNICVQEGDEVEAGAALAVMEAMKMQMTVSAPYSGRVTEICVTVGEQVTEGTELVRLEARND